MIRHKQVTVSKAYDAAARVIKISEGGLGTTSVEEAITMLDTVKASELTTSIPVLGSDGKLAPEEINISDIIVPTISEVSNMYVNSTYTVTITNYDSFVTYNVSVEAGTASISGNTITIVTPSSYSSNVYQLKINGYVFNLPFMLTSISKPSITNINNGSIVDITDTLTFSEFNVINANTGVIHESTDIQIANDSAFNNLVVNKEAYTTTRTEYALNGLNRNTTYYIRIRYRSNTGLVSAWSDIVSFTTRNAYITEPTITGLSNNATNVSLLNTFKSSEFNVTGGEDTHLSSDWEIARDSTFNNIVASSYDDTTNKTSWVSSVTLDSNTSYYVRVRHKGTTLGLSAWSESVYFTTTTPTTLSGRTFYRHSSGMGTVMEWVDKSGKSHKTLVLDAPYRAKKAWCANTSTDVSGITNYTNSYYLLVTNSTSSPSSWSSTRDSNSSSAFFGTTWTDATINGKSMYFEDANSSKSNTDALMANSNCNTTTYAAGWCRSQMVDGVGCDLPNIQTLIRIYLAHYKLDEMDPTSNGNLFLFTKARTGSSYDWYFNNSTGGVWSSSEYSSSDAWYVGCGSTVVNDSKTNTFCVVPVLELE